MFVARCAGMCYLSAAESDVKWLGRRRRRGIRKKMKKARGKATCGLLQVCGCDVRCEV